MIKYILILNIILSSFVYAEYTRFTRLDSGIVVDHEYGLQWQDDVNYTDEWLEAIDYCENLDLGGETDWRMPNINELTFIIDVNYTKPTINSIYQTIKLDNSNCSKGKDFYWSSTSSDENRSKAVGVGFNLGQTLIGMKKEVSSNEQNCSVRCVRSDFD